MHEPRAEASNPALDSVPEVVPFGDVQVPDASMEPPDPVTQSASSRNDQAMHSGNSAYRVPFDVE